MALFAAGVRPPAGGTVRAGVIGDLAEYYGLTDAGVVDRCLYWEAASVQEWHSAPRDSPDGLADFYNSTESWAFDLLWYAYVQTEGYGNPKNVMVADALGDAEGHRQLLDFGSGVGVTAQLFAALGYEVTLADVSRPLLDFAQWRLDRRGVKASYVHLPAELPVAHYDVVNALDTLGHVPDAHVTAGQLHRCLVTGGLLVANYDVRRRSERNAWHLYEDDLPLRWAGAAGRVRADRPAGRDHLDLPGRPDHRRRRAAAPGTVLAAPGEPARARPAGRAASLGPYAARRGIEGRAHGWLMCGCSRCAMPSAATSPRSTSTSGPSGPGSPRSDWRLALPAGAAWRPGQPGPGRILAYHSVGTAEWGINDVTPRMFERHLQTAVDDGWSFATTAEVLAHPDRPQLALTFDDGLATVLTNAVPVLRHHGVPATAFVVTGWADGRHRRGHEYVLDWPGVEALQRGGVRIASHSVTHRDLGRLELDDGQSELEDSRQRLHQVLGLDTDEFAVPFGQSANWSAELARAAAEAGYRTVYAQAVNTRPAGTVPRTYITRVDRPGLFRAALAGAFDNWEE